MQLFLDCEFNEFPGARINGVIDEDGREWSEVVPCKEPGAWVAQHVMPILGKSPLSVAGMQRSLAHWLAQFDAVHIVADWPEDTAHFCNAQSLAQAAGSTRRH